MPEKKGDLSLVNSSWVHNTSIGNTRFHSLDDELKKQSGAYAKSKYIL